MSRFPSLLQAVQLLITNPSQIKDRNAPFGLAFLGQYEFEI